MTKTITAEELRQWIDDKKDFVLVNVLPKEYFEEEHVPSSKNAAVYEMTFLEQIEKIVGDKAQQIVVYDSSAKSEASQTAAEKLLRAGYKNVYDFPGGLLAWKEASYEVKSNGPRIEEVAMLDKTYSVDTKKSVVGWAGRNINNSKHFGTISLSQGELIVKGGHLVGGEFVVDMRTIRNEDVADEKYNKMLVVHLGSDDFFDVERYPEAKFIITSSTPITEPTKGAANYHIVGDFTLKGVTDKIEFPAIVHPWKGGELKAQAHFDFDRTRWNVKYGSGKFFEKLAGHVVNDEISIELQLVGR